MTFTTVSNNGCTSSRLVYDNSESESMFTETIGSSEIIVDINTSYLGVYSFTIEEIALIDSNVKHLTTINVEVLCVPVFPADDT